MGHRGGLDPDVAGDDRDVLRSLLRFYRDIAEIRPDANATQRILGQLANGCDRRSCGALRP